MIVEAVRDDGAELVTDGPAAAIVSGGDFWITSKDAALARGVWRAADDSIVSPALAERLAGPLADMKQRLDERTKPKGRGA